MTAHPGPCKIAVVIPQYRRIGGAENVAFQLCERLAGMPEFEIHVFARKWDAGLSEIIFHKIPMIHFPRWLQPVSFAAFAKRKMAGLSLDLIHSHERIFAMDVMTFHGIPHSAWIRDMRRKHLSGFDRATCWVEQKGLRNPDLKMILPVSSLVKNALLAAYSIPETRISVMHPGVDVARFSRPDAESCRKRIRIQFGLAPSDIVMLFVGMNFEIKRLDLVIQGIAGVSVMERPNVKLLILGKGNPAPYRKMASELGVGNQIMFAGVVSDIESWYPAGDIFVMPSVMDTFGLVVLEAMAAGLPVIISPTVGAADLVIQDDNGIILPDAPSASDMTTAITRLLNPGIRRNMGGNARRTASRHDWNAVSTRLADIYRHVITTACRKSSDLMVS